jgi:hypothetical protein
VVAVEFEDRVEDEEGEHAQDEELFSVLENLPPNRSHRLMIMP